MLRDDVLFGAEWNDDVAEVVSMLDHVRFTGDAMSIVPVAFLPASEIAARGLRACDCGRHGRAAMRMGLLPVESDMSIVVTMVEDGGWQAHLVQRHEDPGQVDDLIEFGWNRCRGSACEGLSLDFLPGCSVWLVAQLVLATMRMVGDLRPGELSCAAVEHRRRGHR